MSTNSQRARPEYAAPPFEPDLITPTQPLSGSPGEPVRSRAAATGDFPPRVLRHYRLVRPLGAGGMGRVYLYRDTKLQRAVAIKFVRELANRADVLREAQAAARIRHPNVVAIHEVDEEHGFIVFEYVAGQRLDTCIPVASTRLLPLARDIARALAEVHGKGLVHGDIKPANIILDDENGSPRLIDFGLALHHGEPLSGEHACIPGTPAYLAPELRAGNQPSTASDVYAFGVLLYQIGTGKLPLAQRVRRDLDGERDPSLPGLLDLIDDCLAPDPDARPRDGRAVLDRLRRLRQRLNDEGDRQMARQRLQRDADEWESDGRNADLLWSKRRLDDVRDLDHGVDLTPTQAAFLAASRRRLRQTRLARGVISAAVLSLVALVAAGVRALLLQDIVSQVQATRDDYEQARPALREARGRRDVIFGRLRDDPTDDAAMSGWPGVLTELVRLESELHRIDMALDMALILAPDLELLRKAAASVAYERLRLAQDLDRSHDARQLEIRVDAYATQIENRCRQSVPVALEVHPVPAVLNVQQYQIATDGQFTPVAHGEHLMRDAELGLELAPGSYLLTLQADPERAEVRYPLHIDCEASPLTLTIDRLRQESIPPDFVYVPAGNVRYGFGRNPDQELLRTWMEALPLHEREVAPFLIARHETTFQEWIEFLDACTRNTCADVVARPPLVSAAFPGESPLQLVVTASGWLLEIRPDPSAAEVVYRAGQGQTLAYPERQQPRREQRWERMPVTGVSWDDMQGYLRWLHTSGRVPGARLCREDEWERAARGADGRLYPHGNSLQPGDANYDQTYGRKTLAYGLDEVGSHPASASPFGIHDMAGNAWEMVAPWDDDGRSTGVLRGGSYYQSALDAVTANRWHIERSDSDSRVGFRVCAPAPGRAFDTIEK
jgi:serine/threonine protein kinase/formylglycine-generating enzyme required for sulfatase activity